MCLFVGCGSCAPLDNGVPKCAVDFMVLLGKAGVFRLQILVVRVMCPGSFWCVLVVYRSLFLCVFSFFSVY